METTVDFNVDQDSYIPERLDPQFILGEPLTSYSGVRVACRGPDCNYVAKKISADPTPLDGCYSRRDLARNEILISELAGRANVGPRIHAKSLDQREGTIVMDKYDGTLAELIQLYQTDKSIPIDEIMRLAGRLLETLHQNTIIHRDFHPGNIFYTQGGIFAVGDYELALISDSPQLKQLDRQYYQNMLNTVQRVKAGGPYDISNVWIDTAPSPFPEIRYIWKGKICLDPLLYH